MNNSTKSLPSLSRLYDQLSRFMMWKNLLTRGDRFASLTMHKTLNIPPEKQNFYNKKNQSEYVNDLAFEAIQLGENPVVLDVGCGFGGTIFRWYSCQPGQYHGFSLSPYQIKMADRQARKQGISSQCRFFVRSYEDPIMENYQVIISIESFIHARDLSQAIANVTSSLLPNGQLIIIEDMAAEDLSPDDVELWLLKKAWLLYQFPRRSHYLDCFQENGLQVVIEKDLTEWVNVRPARELKNRKRNLQLLQKLSPSKNWQLLLQAFIGGLALEELYRCRRARYVLLVGRKT